MIVPVNGIAYNFNITVLFLCYNFIHSANNAVLVQNWTIYLEINQKIRYWVSSRGTYIQFC